MIRGNGIDGKFTFGRRLDGGSGGNDYLLRAKNSFCADGKNYRARVGRIYRGGKSAPLDFDL